MGVLIGKHADELINTEDLLAFIW